MTSPGGGFEIAEAYVEIHADKSQLRKDINALPQDLGPEAERAGGKIGERLGNGLVRDARGKIRNSRGQFASDAELALAGIDPVAEKRGRDAGGKLAQGMRMSFVRNSPLIVAAIGGALAAGAPLLLAGSTALFTGIGALAAAQSNEVRSAWLGMFQTVRDKAVSDAGVLVPVYVDMAEDIGAAFDRMRPRIRDAFVAGGPQVEVFTRGITDLAENALPGMVRAVERGMPVTEGLASMLGRIGTGWSEMFDRMSVHSEAAGVSLDAIGRILGALLPILGTFMGTGAELAAVVLPPLASVLEVLADVLQDLSPILPGVVVGLTGLKIASAVSGGISTLAGKLGEAATKGGLFAPAAGRVSSGLAGIATAAGPVAVALVAATMGFAAAEQKSKELASALLEGGAAAAAARSEIDSTVNSYDTGSSAFDAFLTGLTGTNLGLALNRSAALDAGDAMKDMLADMNPVQRTAALLTQAENDLSFALEKHGEGSREVASAQAAYDSALAASEQANADLEMAISGVTEAMMAQADQALASIDAGFAHRQAQLATRDAMEQLRTTMSDSAATADDVAAATLNVEQALFREAQAAAEAKVSVSDLEAGTDDYNRMVQVETLAALAAMRDGLDPQMRAAVDSMIASLERGGISLDELGGKKPTPTVDLNDLPLIGKTNNSFALLDLLAGKRPVPFADLNDGSLVGRTQTDMGLLDVLGRQRPTPVSSLNTGPFDSGTNWLSGRMSWINSLRSYPLATMLASTGGAEGALNWTARNRTSYVTQVVSQVAAAGAALFRATGGSIGSAPVERYAFGGSPGGKVQGPGTGTSDSVGPFLTARGADAYLSDDEWVIKALSALKYGDQRMGEVNDGVATILTRDEARRIGLANGGQPDAPLRGSSATDLATPAGIRDLHVHLDGSFDLRNPGEVRRLAVALRRALDDLTREES